MLSYHAGLARFGLSDPVVRDAIWSSYTPLQQQSITQVRQ